MPRPRLLYLATRFPWPLDRGDRIRAYRLIEQFSSLAEVTLVTFHDRPAIEAPVDRILPFCERVEVVHLPRETGVANMLAAVPGRLPFQVAHYRSPAMETLVDRLAREPWDLAFAQLFRMRPYLDRIRARRKVLELSDSLALNLERAAAIKPWWAQVPFRVEWRRVERYERESLSRADESWVVAEPDKADLLARSPGARIEVIPMGLEDRWGGAGLTVEKDRHVLFLGNLTVGHNLDTARYLVGVIWPRVRAVIPDAQLTLVGSAGPRATRLADPVSGVAVTGFVDDLSPLLSRAMFGVAPLRYGAGLQNKVIELMSAGLPSVVTPMVADGIGEDARAALVVAPAPEQFADAMVRLLRDPERARAMGIAGREFVRTRYSWTPARERMAELLRETESVQRDLRDLRSYPDPSSPPPPPPPADTP
ncbi:MAG TPA: glycosyltransferase family 4 protein [Candidatus Eisenbacteria bacterium]